MVAIKNNSKGAIGLSPEVVIEAGDTMDIEPEVLEALGNSAVVKFYFTEGLLSAVEDTSEPEPELEPELEPEPKAAKK